eukprot:Nk52_evm7s539 gene=Nk52_evmTU7s539
MLENIKKYSSYGSTERVDENSGGERGRGEQNAEERRHNEVLFGLRGEVGEATEIFLQRQEEEENEETKRLLNHDEEYFMGSKKNLSSPDGDSEHASFSEEFFQFFRDCKEDSKQITLRAVIVGLMIGTLLCFSNMYFGLQTGWITMGSLPSTLIGFAVFKGLAKTGLPWFQDFSEYENVALQTVSVATATMPLAGGFVGIIVALEKIPEAAHLQLDSYELLLWSLSIAFFGLFFAIPLRRQTILVEKLQFPSGTATATMVQTLHSKEKGKDWKKTWDILVASFTVSASYVLLSYFYPILQALPVFAWTGTNWGWTVTSWGWTFKPAFSYIGQGQIMGPRVGYSALMGSFIGWAFLGPLAKSQGWAPGAVTSWSNGAQGWILWVALALMISESLVSLGIMCLKIISDWKSYRAYVVVDPAPKSQRVPTWLWTSGLALSTALCVSIDSPVFGMPFWQPLVAVIVACLVSLISVRALGETDYNPVNGIGKISQILFSFCAPGNITANLVAGAIAEAGAMQAGDMMQDLKTGHLVGASPRAQFWAQCIGTLMSVFTAVGAFELYRNAYVIPGPELSAPSHQIWIDMARLLNQGIGALAVNVHWFVVAGAIVGIILPALENRYPKYRFYIPSGVAMAVGMYLPPYWVIPRAFGAFIVWYWSKVDPNSCAKYNVIVASGFVVGEGLISILTASFHSFGVQPLSCMACSKELIALGMSMCGGC